jgi:four helix bundle protein
MEKSHNFRKLEIWKRSMTLVKSVYGTTSTPPESEKFRLISQMNRCAVSVPSNIAEGSGRTSNKDFIRFLRNSISSSYELETQLILCKDLFNLEVEELITDLEHLQNMIGGFIKKLNEK